MHAAAPAVLGTLVAGAPRPRVFKSWGTSIVRGSPFASTRESMLLLVVAQAFLGLVLPRHQ
jgi:hypothetical protein